MSDRAPSERTSSRPGPILITGGAGFIATNLATHLLEQGRHVVLFDNLSRPGVEHNLRWVQGRYGRRVELHVGDVRDVRALTRAAAGVSEVYHLAAQVAVTTSLLDPLDDFEVNARGTLNVLEVIRARSPQPSLVYTSTNKVYGALGDLGLAASSTRYAPVNDEVRQHGIDESRELAFHSPYGCSKGAADQYVLDYAKTFGLSAVVLRMSCIYGAHQCGNEDQGWVAHFGSEVLGDRPLMIYGDGRQVRDVLFASDLARALVLAQANAARLAGQAFNIGGGASRAISLLELLGLLERLTRRPVRCAFAPWRAADQRYYVSDIRRFQKATGWQPHVSVEEGLSALVSWLQLGAGRVSPAAAS